MKHRTDSSSPNAGRSRSTAQPRVHSLKKSPLSSETDIVLNIPEYVPSDGILLIDEFPKETMQKYWK